MKAIISNSLSYYTSFLVPTERLSCMDLLLIASRSPKHSYKFSPTRVAAEFIFDEVYDVDSDGNHIDQIEELIDGEEQKRVLRRLINDLSQGSVDLSNRPWSSRTFLNSRGYCRQDGDALERLLPANLRAGKRLDENQVFLSPDPLLNRISSFGLQNASDGEMLLRLASSGVHFALPALGTIDLEVVRDFRAKNGDLREKYLAHWATLFRICRISEDDDEALTDIIKTEMRAELRRLDAVSSEIEEAAAQSREGRLGRLSRLPVSEGIPGIFGSLFQLFTTGSPKDLAEELVGEAIRLFKAWKQPENRLKSLTKKHPAATYIYQMKQLAE